jgi:steroid delta-isomerase-like uncharacterized protein
MITAQDNATLARTIYNLFNLRKLDEATTHLTPEVKFITVPLNENYTGHEGFKKFAQKWITAMPDCRIEVKNVVAAEEGVAIEYIGRGTHTGPFVGPTGTIQPTSKKVELVVCEFLKLKNGKIAESHTYFDSAALLRQLGIQKLL